MHVYQLHARSWCPRRSCLLGDSAFTNQSFIVVASKEPPREQEVFEDPLAGAHITSLLGEASPPT
jgi:hypothetical protein